MLEEILAFAPVLTPRVCPKGFEDDGMLQLCRTEEQQEDLTSSLREFQTQTESCTICSARTGEDNEESLKSYQNARLI